MKGIQLELGFEDKRSLFETILDTYNLKIAFKRVKANKGAPGIDNITIEEYGQNLEEELNQLKEEVQSWSYKPTPAKRVTIPKPNGKGTRNLGIPIIKDRVLHMAIKQVLEPILELTFSENSYGFRPGRNQQQAVQKAKRIVESGKEFVVDIDLSKFFDRINHDRLIHRLKAHIDDTRVLRLIGMILRSGVMIDGIKTPTEEGSAQLKFIEAHIRRRLRARIISQQKKKRNLVAKLIKRGVAKKQAVNTVYSNRKTWALSHTKAIEKAFPNRWFSDTLNQIIVSDKKLNHWFGQDVWVKLM